MSEHAFYLLFHLKIYKILSNLSEDKFFEKSLDMEMLNIILQYT